MSKVSAGSRASRVEEAAAVWVDIKALKPWDRNPRVNDQSVPAVAASIKRFGFASPIIARKADGEIIAGHTRIKAAQSLGLKSVPVRYMDLDAADAHLLAVADNKLNEKADWSSGLGDVLSEFSFTDVKIAGWDSDELEKMSSGIIGSSSSDDGGESGTRLGETLTYQVVVTCTDEVEQTELIERLESDGLKCQPVVL